MLFVFIGTGLAAAAILYPAIAYLISSLIQIYKG